MCGRLDVKGEEVNEAVQIDLGISFSASSNRDLKPTQTVSTVTMQGDSLQQLDTRWGIKPAWAKSHLINAKCETVTEKQTFTKAFAFQRCLVPCTGFYEWMKTSKGKVKVWFHHREGGALYMGAFWYPGETPELVTLTRDAPIEHMHIHNRFPVPAYRGGSQKAEWLINAADLASHIDAQREAARHDWERINGRTA